MRRSIEHTFDGTGTDAWRADLVAILARQVDGEIPPSTYAPRGGA